MQKKKNEMNKNFNGRFHCIDSTFTLAWIGNMCINISLFYLLKKIKSPQNEKKQDKLRPNKMLFFFLLFIC